MTAARLRSVDALRGVAVLAVLLFHVSPPRAGRPFAFLPTDLGHLGVTLFLVLSGFCIHLGCARRMAGGAPARVEWLAFWRRRFFRLYPPYLVAMALSVAPFVIVYAVKSHRGQPAEPPWPDAATLWGDIGTHLLMVHNLFPAFYGGMKNTAFWSLGLEEQLYALYAAYLAARRRVRLRWIVAATLLLGMAWRAVAAVAAGRTLGTGPFALGAWVYWSVGHLFAWALGAVAAEHHAGAITLSAKLWRRRSLVVAFAGALALYFSELEFAAKLLFAFAFFLWLLRWLAQESRRSFPAWLVWLGTISYSLYLVHLPVIWQYDGRVAVANAGWDLLARFAVLPPVCVTAAWAFYLAVERRFLNRPRPADRPGSPPPAAV